MCTKSNPKIKLPCLLRFLHPLNSKRLKRRKIHESDIPHADQMQSFLNFAHFAHFEVKMLKMRKIHETPDTHSDFHELSTLSTLSDSIVLKMSIVQKFPFMIFRISMLPFHSLAEPHAFLEVAGCQKCYGVTCAKAGKQRAVASVSSILK